MTWQWADDVRKWYLKERKKTPNGCTAQHLMKHFGLRPDHPNPADRAAYFNFRWKRGGGRRISQ